VVIAGMSIRRMNRVLRIPGLFVCAAAVALSLPSRPALERECVIANVEAHPAACLVSDLDGDRQADYAVSIDLAGQSLHPASISIHLSSAPQGYQLLLPDGLSVLSFIFRDVDGDGHPDIALLGGFNETVGVFLNDGSGGFRFDSRDRYLTPPNHDLSEMAPPPLARASDCAEPGSGSSCAVSSQSRVVGKLHAASMPIAHRPTGLDRCCFSSARSRAP
jgi:hypothetical protein